MSILAANFMSDNRPSFLAQFFFRGQQPHLQRRKLHQLVAAILVGLVVAAIVGVLMYYQSSMGLVK